MKAQKEQIEKLIEKASKADKADDAMKFSQAAVNAANAVFCLSNAEREFRHVESGSSRSENERVAKENGDRIRSWTGKDRPSGKLV